MNKTSIIILVVVALAVALGAGYYFMQNGQPPAGQTGNASSSAPVAGAGEHCGGNMMNAPICGTGYKCAPDPNSHLPFGDVGGLCVSIQAQGGY